MPKAPSYDIVHTGGEVFASMDEPSDKSVLWGELFAEKERLFFRKELTTEIACFSIKDTFQISVRCLWQPIARTKQGHRPGTTIALIHSIEFPLTSSWTWVKLARPLYKSGFSVVMIDLPGFGRSKMNMDPAVKLEEWQHQDWHIICQTLDELRVHSCLTMCIGQICGTILRILARSPHSLGKEHIFLEPSFDPADVLGDLAGAPPPGAGSNWREIMRQKYKDALEKILRTSKARIWSMHDKGRMTKTLFDTQALLSDTMQHTVLSTRTLITQFSKSDMCCCHIGAKLPFSFLYPRKHLLQEIVEFFIRREKGWDIVLSMPKYISADPTNPEGTWTPEMCPQLLDKLRQGADSNESNRNALDRENPLRAIMRKSREVERIKSENHLLGMAKDAAKTEEDAAAQLPPKGTLERARHRAGPEASKHIQWMDFTQTKHQVRMIQGRNQCTMFTSASDAFKLTGGAESAQGFRVGLLSKLSPTQRYFVAEHQSIEEHEEEERVGELNLSGGAQDSDFKVVVPRQQMAVRRRAERAIAIHARRVLSHLPGARRGAHL
eukprot:TRINITY_DN22376_c0_g1_i3.p1 TRINITY_DN22376_c0_g1~~TRINITY_DN22376_c0_g1_i3.p1  ORF type:complete len:552 (+),score=80.49 TRINITY_DN22376_c0_g1_i3:111-1766(+)